MEIVKSRKKKKMNKKDITVFIFKGLLKRSDFVIGSTFPAAMV